MTSNTRLPIYVVHVDLHPRSESSQALRQTVGPHVARSVGAR